MAELDWSRFEDYTEQLMHEHNIVGASVAVAKEGEVIYAKGFGVRDVENQLPVNPETMFGIASISKSFTALVISQLQDEGLLSVDDPVVDYLPEFKLRGVENMRDIKIRHLLSHTTGLPPMRRRQDIEFFDDHLNYLANAGYKLLGEPGEYFSYSNDAFLLSGAIIERVTGQLYRRAMTQRVIERLGMNRSTYSLEEIDKFDNVSVPYIYDEDEEEYETPPWPDLGTYEVGGGVRSNVLDLMKYGQVYINDGVFEGEQLLNADSIRRMREPVYKMGRNTHYGFALRITPDHDGFTLVEHGGGQPGVSSNFGFVPEEKIAVAVLTNVTKVPAGSIWLAAVNTALQLPIDKQRSVEPDYEATEEELQNLIGVYTSKEGANMRVFWDDDALKIELLEKEFYVRPSSDRSLVVQDGTPGDTVIWFYLDDEGKPWAAFNGSRMLRKVPRVT